ncbi:MAG TPA: DUF1992 domain-containing protein [Chloroflexota bacterium]|nr:DUF1992 domain-containing protein [Chloroflexota bacterium]
MSPIRHEGDRKIPIKSWESHVDLMIREAQARGEFDNLPGAGKPLQLEENPFGAEWQLAHRIAKNAGAAPLWVTLQAEIGEDAAALQAMAEQTARYLGEQAARIAREAQEGQEGSSAGASQAGASQAGASQGGQRGQEGGAPAAPAASHRGRRWWLFSRRLRRQPPAAPAALTGPRSMAELEAERQRARSRYLDKAAALDDKIQQYNRQRPRELTWLEKPRLLPGAAAEQFDRVCPPLR